MAYFAPYISEAGLTMPTYTDIRDQIIEDAKNIFGQDIYLEEDSQDYQWIATVSEKIYDAFQLAQFVYNNRGPSVATGSALDAIVKINGIKRKSESHSKVNVVVTGIPGTIIKNGIVLDKGNIQWNLPEEVEILEEGEGFSEAICSIPGPIVANAGDIVNIFNPIYGWHAVYNTESGDIGINVETDGELRKRQSQSTAQPSLTMLEGTVGAVAQIADVNRSKVYENDTSEIDERGLPPHSITAVVEGGDEEEIAKAIWIHKGIGCYTNGDVIVDIVDSKEQITPIRFFRPTYVDIEVNINIKTINSYTSKTTEDIKASLKKYLNSLEIGVGLSVSSLWGAALQAMPNLMNPMFSITGITACRLGEEPTTDEIEFEFNEICRGNINYINTVVE